MQVGQARQGLNRVPVAPQDIKHIKPDQIETCCYLHARQLNSSA